MAFKQLSKIDKRTKYSVHGWIRNKEKSLGLTTIPSMINAICILYFRDDEIFNVINGAVKLSENKKIITSLAGDFAFLIKAFYNYGIMEIVPTSNLVYQWDLRIVKCTENDCIYFGITSTKSEELFGDGHHYAFKNGGEKTKTDEKWKSYGEEIRTGDIVSINLDLKKAQIKLIINGKDQGIAYENVDKSKDIKYRLFVTLLFKNDCVEILNFSKQ